MRVSLLRYSAMLALAYPAIAGSWLGTVRGRFHNPDTIVSTSTKQAWWKCGVCQKDFKRRVVDHVSSAGECTYCGSAPSLPQVHKAIPRPINAISGPTSLIRPKLHITDVLNCSESGIPRECLAPMLAKTYSAERRQRGIGSVVVSPKIDGVRCLIARNRLGDLFFFSRHGLLFECCDHLVDAVRPILAEDPLAVLDGELYFRREGNALTFHDLLSAVGTTRLQRSASTKAIQEQLQFHAFDIAHAGMQKFAQASFTSRLEHLHDISRRRDERAVQIVPVVPTLLSDVDDHLQRYLSEGYEGCIVRATSARYEHGKRSNALLKLKASLDAEYPIVGVVEGRGKLRNAVGAFVCLTSLGEKFTVSPSVSSQERARMWSNADRYIGAALTVQFQDISPNGIPRFPVGKAIRGASMQKNTWI